MQRGSFFTCSGSSAGGSGVIWVGGGESGYIFRLDAMITEKRLNSLLRICVIGIELANKIHKFRERDDLLTVSGVMETHLGEEMTKLHKLGETTGIALP